jgi:CRISPR/Cas system-associated exonuclease Cas4 (RecB family)
MSEYYNPKKTRNLFSPKSEEPFTISRSGIDLFTQCPRCFYIEKRLGTSRPPGYPFSLNNAVDALLKKEFDAHRANRSAHPLMKKYKIDAIPYDHEKLEEWRNSRTQGIKFFYQPANLIVRGGVDDIWLNNKKELHIVDYKATSKSTEVNLDAEWQKGYKRQVEVYQWLFRRNDFPVSNIAYFVYCNGDADKEAFDGKLEFDIKVIPYEGNDDWIEGTLGKIKECLESDKLPESGKDCDYCSYREAAASYERRQ